MVQNQNLPEDTFLCKDCVLIVQRKYANHRMEISDSMDTLLIYEGDEVVQTEPTRKMTPGCRYCKGYFSHQMSLIKKNTFNQELATALFKAFYKNNENWN